MVTKPKVLIHVYGGVADVLDMEGAVEVHIFDEDNYRDDRAEGQRQMLDRLPDQFRQKVIDAVLGGELPVDEGDE